MKKSIFLSLMMVVLPISLSSCTSNISISIFNNVDNKVINISSDNLDYLIPTNIEKILYLTSSTCQSCINPNTYMDTYINTYGLKVFKYDVSANLDYQTIFNKYPDVFKNRNWPQIISFEEGKCLTSTTFENNVTYTSFSKQMEIFKKSNIKTTQDKNKIETLVSNDNYLIFSSDMKNANTYKIFNDFKDKAETSIINTYFLDINRANEAIDYIKTTYQISENCFALLKKNGQIYQSNYLNDEQSLKTIINLL